jgi:GDP-L-fucose synthase
VFEVRDATVVVTGGTGFLGSHLVDALEREGARVIGLGRRDYDLRDRDAIQRMLDATRPDALVHLAAVVGGIGANRAEPGRFFYENAVMGIELLESCRRAGVAKIVVAGTVCAYPKHTPVPFSERDLWTGYPDETNAPYGLAKKMLLVQAEAYRAQYGSNIVTLLPANLYGPGDNFDPATSHVIPAMIRRFAAARDHALEEVTLWGDGTATREFVFVEDAAHAFVLALERYDAAEPVNVGSGAEISIRELAALVAELCGYGGAITWDASQPNGQPRRQLDTGRARTAFGFEVSTPLREGLRQTIDWYARHG